MTISQTLSQYSKRLKSSSPLLDVELLLSHVLNKPKEHLYAYPEKKLTTTQLNNFTTLFKRRSKGEPIAYILGHKEFYGLDFKVNKNVLIPRPETEELVEEVIKYTSKLTTNQLKTKPLLSICDVGVGSGAIIIALAKSICHPACPPELQRRREHSRRIDKCFNPQFIGTDISNKALTVAKHNAKLHGVFCHGELSRTIDKKPCIKFLQGNLLEPLTILQTSDFGLPDVSSAKVGLRTSDFGLQTSIIVTNLPYLTTKQLNNPQLNHEPKSALSGGPDGLKYFREFFNQLHKFKIQPQAIFLEIGHNQAIKITKLAKLALPKYKVASKKDMCGFDRILIITK